MSYKPLAFRTASLKRGAFAIPVVLTVLISAPSTYAQIPCGGYEVTAIIQAPECPPFGFPPTIGRGISEPIDGGLPNVVGHYQSCTIGPDTAFLWIGNENKFTTLPVPPGTIRSWAFDITPDGAKIAGAFDLSGDGLANLGFLYNHETGKFTNLGTLPGGNWSEALAINAKGDATGFWGNSAKGPLPLAFVRRGGEMIDISGDFGTPNSHGNDINSRGQATGWMGTGQSIDSHAFIWDDGEVTELPPIARGFTSIGQAITCSRQVVGWGLREEGPLPVTVTRAFFWDDDNGAMTDLGTLPNHLRSAALDIRSDPLQIVGQSWNVDGNTNISHGFIWHDGLMVALDDLVDPQLGIHMKVARAINASGQIIAGGTTPQGTVAFLLTSTDPPLGDLDGDCTVGVVDLLILLGDWGPCQGCPSDLNRDGIVGVADLLILLGNWG